MRIYLDMDGVIVNLVKKWLKFYNKDFKDNLTPNDLKSFNTSDHVKCGEVIYRYLALPEFFKTDLEPYEGALETIQKLYEENLHEIYILTSPHEKSSTCWHDKKTWINEHLSFIDSKDIIYSHHKHLNCHPGDIILEDKPETLLKWKQQGGISVCMDRPWNQNCECSHRVKGWENFYWLIKNIESEKL